MPDRTMPKPTLTDHIDLALDALRRVDQPTPAQARELLEIHVEMLERLRGFAVSIEHAGRLTGRAPIWTTATAGNQLYRDLARGHRVDKSAALARLFMGDAA